MTHPRNNGLILAFLEDFLFHQFIRRVKSAGVVELIDKSSNHRPAGEIVDFFVFLAVGRNRWSAVMIANLAVLYFDVLHIMPSFSITELCSFSDVPLRMKE